MNYHLTYERLMKRRLSRRIAIPLVATILVAALGAGVIYAGLATRDVGKTNDKLVISDLMSLHTGRQLVHPSSLDVSNIGFTDYTKAQAMALREANPGSVMEFPSR